MPRQNDKNHGRAADTGPCYFTACLRRENQNRNQTERKHAMITREQLMAVLEKAEPYDHRATDWRKLPNGRVMRFVRWGWKLTGKKLTKGAW